MITKIKDLKGKYHKGVFPFFVMLNNKRDYQCPNQVGKN